MASSTGSEYITEHLLGKPFQTHGRGPHAFDCLGLVLHMVEVHDGVELPDPLEGPGCARKLKEFRDQFIELPSLAHMQEGDVLRFAVPTDLRDQHLGWCEDSRSVVICNPELGVIRRKLTRIRNYPTMELFRLKCRT